MVLHAGKQSLPEPWVMILDLEGRLDGRQAVFTSFVAVTMCPLPAYSPKKLLGYCVPCTIFRLDVMSLV